MNRERGDERKRGTPSKRVRFSENMGLSIGRVGRPAEVDGQPD